MECGAVVVNDLKITFSAMPLALLMMQLLLQLL